MTHIRRSREALGGEPLSTRERQVLTGMARGHRDAAIAENLGISPLTAKSHSFRTLAKLRARNRAHAVAIALRTGILPDTVLDTQFPTALIPSQPTRDSRP